MRADKVLFGKLKIIIIPICLLGWAEVAQAQNCPADYPIFSEECNRCFRDARQASDGGCPVSGDPAPAPDPEPTPPDPEPTPPDPEPTPPDPEPTPPAPGTTEVTNLAADLPNPLVRREGNVIITQAAARGRRRHETSGVPGLDPNGNPANPNHFNYHLEYWNDRVYQLEIRDYTATNDSRIEFTLNTVGPQASNGSAADNVPYVKCFKDYGDETNYFLSPQPVPVTPGSRTQWQYVFREYQQDTDTAPGRNRETSPDIRRPFQRGDMIECEVTIRWQAIVDAGETQQANYYGEVFRYRVGVGGLIGFNRDPNNGPTIMSMNSMIGGFLTSPIIHPNETPRAYMQPTLNMEFANLEAFLEGRRVFRTSFIDGTHADASNSSNGANPSHPALALGASNFDDRCSDCHLDDGNGVDTNTDSGFLTPRLVGLGLIEAIPASTIRGWADPNDGDSDGISGQVSSVSGGLGRFGYQATQSSLRSQIVAALSQEMGASSVSSIYVDQLVAYISLLAVPSARSPNLLQHSGWDEFNEFGCAACHKVEVETGSHSFAELERQVIRPFTDVLLHDLGEGEFRTTPLMGIGLAGAVRSVAKDPEAVGFSSTVNGHSGAAQNDLANRDNNDYMIWHDGSCTGANAFDCAIRKHGVEGSTARDRYTGASSSRQQQLIQFLRDI